MDRPHFICHPTKLSPLIPGALFCAALFAGIGPVSTSSAATVSASPAADFGDPAPGTTDKFDGFEIPIVNNTGINVGFRGYLKRGSGVTAQNDAAVWIETSPGVLSLVARTGSQAPGVTAGAKFALFEMNPIFNNQNRAAFSARLTGKGVNADNDTGIWAHDTSGTFALVARAQGTAPGFTNGTKLDFFTEKNDPVYNNAGQVGFYSALKFSTGDVTSDNYEALFLRNKNGAMKVVARRGSPAEGAPAGVKYGSGTFSEMSLNDAGQIAFKSQLKSGEGGVNSNNDIAIFAGTPGSMTMRARKGDLAPGTTSKFTDFLRDDDTYPIINEAGRVAFYGSLNSGKNYEGIWSEGSTGTLALVARLGGPAPGITNGTFQSFSHFTFDNSGRVAFAAYLNEHGSDITFRNQQVVYAQDATGALKLIARQGDTAPGTPAGTVFDGNFTNPVMNKFGQVIFVSNLSGPKIGEADDVALFGTDRSGVLKEIIRYKDKVRIAAGDARIMDFFYYSPNTDSRQGRAISFNDLGQIGILLEFDDLTAVPATMVLR